MEGFFLHGMSHLFFTFSLPFLIPAYSNIASTLLGLFVIKGIHQKIPPPSPLFGLSFNLCHFYPGAEYIFRESLVVTWPLGQHLWYRFYKKNFFFW